MAENRSSEVSLTYLRDLRAALSDVPGEVREGILTGVQEELHGLSEAGAVDRIRELGDPKFIAAEAHAGSAASREHPADSPGHTPWFAIIAALLVMVGGIVIPVLGAIAGTVMVWLSPAWTRTEKWIATLIPLSLIVIAAGVAVAFSLRPAASVVGTDEASHNPLLPGGADALWLGSTVVLVVQVGIGVWLLVRARRQGMPHQ